MDTYILGKIRIASKAITISDPCYGTDLISGGSTNVTIPVKNGPWKVQVNFIKDKKGDTLIQSLTAWLPDSVEGDLEKVNDMIPVDSGQIALVDSAYYPAEDTGEVGDLDSFYGQACDITQKKRYGLFEDKTGAVVIPGHGNGIYYCRIGKNNEGKTVKVYVEFIDNATTK